MLNILTHALFFKGLSQAEIEEVSQFCTEIIFIAGDEVSTRARFDNRNLYLLYSGNLEALSAGEVSVETVLNEQEPELVGEIAWLMDVKRSITQRCISDVSALMIDGEAFTGWLEENPRAGFLVMKNLAHILARRLLDKELFLGY